MAEQEYCLLLLGRLYILVAAVPVQHIIQTVMLGMGA
jgi:hypothetical protein